MDASSSRIRVYCRVKPSVTGWCPYLQLLPDERTILATRPSKDSRLPPRATSRGASQKHRSNNINNSTDDESSGLGVGSSSSRLPGDERTQSFVFDHVLRDTEAAADGLYQRTTAPLLESGLMRGVHATLLSYGEPSTDKSQLLFGGRAPSGAGHTQTSTSASTSTPTRTTTTTTTTGVYGVAQRALQHIYRAGAAAAEERQQEVTLVFLQFYGETISDLLDPTAIASAASALGSSGRPVSPARGGTAHGTGRSGPSVSLDGNGAVVVRGVCSRTCATEADALACVSDGLMVWRSSAHAAASNVVLRVTLRQQPVADALGVESCCAHLHLVDLASTRRLAEGMDATARAEVQTVNKSASALEQVVNALATAHSASSFSTSAPPPELSSPSAGDARHRGGGGGGEAGSAGPHVPYRQSKLTTFLKGYIGLHTSTALVCHVEPTETHLEATLSTLSFAKRLLRVPVAPTTNTYTSAENQVRQLQRELQAARVELRLHTQLQQLHPRDVATDGTGPAAIGMTEKQSRAQEVARAMAVPLGADEQRDMEARVGDFLSGAAPSVDVQDVREMRSAFAMLRAAVESRDEALATLKGELQQRPRTPPPSSSQDSAAAAGGSDPSLAEDGTGGGREKGRGARASRASAGKNAAAAAAAAASEADASVSKANAEIFTSSVLDTSRGFGYGSSTRAGVLRAPLAPVTSSSATPPLTAPRSGKRSSRVSVTATATTTTTSAESAPPSAPPTTGPPVTTAMAAAPPAPRRATSPPLSVTTEPAEAAVSSRPPTAPARATTAAHDADMARPPSGRPPVARQVRPRSAGANALLLAISATQQQQARPGSGSLIGGSRPASGSVRRMPSGALVTVAADDGTDVGSDGRGDAVVWARKRALFHTFKSTTQGLKHRDALARVQEGLGHSQNTCERVQELHRTAQSVLESKRVGTGGLATVRAASYGGPRLSTRPSSQQQQQQRQRSTQDDRALTMAVFQRTPSLSPPQALGLTPSPSDTPLSLDLLPRPVPISRSPLGLSLDVSGRVAAHDLPQDAQVRQHMAPMTVAQAEHYVGRLHALLDQCLAQRDADVYAVEKHRLAFLQGFELWYERDANEAAAKVSTATTQDTTRLPPVAPLDADPVRASSASSQRERGPKKGTARTKAVPASDIALAAVAASPAAPLTKAAAH